MAIANIMAGFSITGIFPIDRNKVISKLEVAMFALQKQLSELS